MFRWVRRLATRLAVNVNPVAVGAGLTVENAGDECIGVMRGQAARDTRARASAVRVGDGCERGNGTSISETRRPRSVR